MPFQGTVNPDQLAVLTRALTEHCNENGITLDSPVRDNVASRILYLFNHGVQELDPLKQALRSDRAM